MDRYTRKELLGRGGFAKVYRVIDNHTGKECAMKVIDTSLMKSENCDNEISVLETISHLSHPNIVKYETSFKDPIKKKCIIVMEYCKGIIKIYYRRGFERYYYIP